MQKQYNFVHTRKKLYRTWYTLIGTSVNKACLTLFGQKNGPFIYVVRLVTGREIERGATQRVRHDRSARARHIPSILYLIQPKNCFYPCIRDNPVFESLAVSKYLVRVQNCTVLHFYGNSFVRFVSSRPGLSGAVKESYHTDRKLLTAFLSSLIL